MRFESGPVGAQSVEIRVTDTPVDGDNPAPANTMLSSVDGSEVIHFTSSIKDNFKLYGFFLVLSISNIITKIKISVDSKT